MQGRERENARSGGGREETGKEDGIERERERERVDATTRKDRHEWGGGGEGGTTAKGGGREREGPENEFRF